MTFVDTKKGEYCKLRYNINNDNLSRVFYNIEKELEESKETIDELLKIDYQYCKIKTSLEQLKRVIEMLRNEKLDIQNEQVILVRYNGNPSITLNLSLLAVLTKTTLILDFDEHMLGVNTLIANIINNTLLDFKTENLIYLKSLKMDNVQEINKIICIDDIYKYDAYVIAKNDKARFYSLNYLDLYRDSNEFDDITQLIYQYAEENQIPVESYAEFEPEEAAQMIKTGFGASVVVLTKNKETKQIFEKNIKNKKVNINKNPFEQEVKIIEKGIFNI